MSVDIQADDLFAAPASPTWTNVYGTWTADTSRVYPTTLLTETVSVLSAYDPASQLSASTPKKIRYQCTVTMPSTFPATGEIRVGLGAFMQSANRSGFWLTYRRTSGGASTYVELAIRRPTSSSASDSSLFSVFSGAGITALAADGVGVLRLDLTLNPIYWLAEGYFNGVKILTSTPTVNLFSSFTGQALFNNAYDYPMFGGIVGNVAARSYVDAFTIADFGSLTAVDPLYVAPTLTAFPTLTPLTMTAEDEGGTETLPVQPSYVLSGADRWEVSQWPYSGGYTAFAARQTAPRREWPSLNWEAMSDVEVFYMDAFLTAVKTRVGTWNWVFPETGETVRCRFTTEPVIKYVAPSVWEMQAGVIEVLAGA